MKKIIIPFITLIFIISLILIIISLNKTKEITSKKEIEIIKQDSNLDILINLGNFTIENYSERMLLDVAMQYAEKLNLMNEINNDSMYLQYVSKEDIHNLIHEFSGLIIEAPIEIDDFYYLYNGENSTYYYLGASPSYYKISNITNIKKTNNNYEINCSIEKNEDTEIISKDNVLVTLKYVPENSIIKYQVDQIIIKD